MFFWHQDRLTGIANRRFFDKQLHKAWHKAQRTGSSLSLLLCDIDHFKHFNNYYGRTRADDCLRQVAKHLRATLQHPKALAARYEGKKIAILLPQTDAHKAFIIADQLLSDVRS
ncbi:MAG: diguanylate cyclase, partial [Candidatus Electrothrix sp. ATG1]|nr:diguanylate cyclase [Candidatus Electrothrix sp. ATG1]